MKPVHMLLAVWLAAVLAGSLLALTRTAEATPAFAQQTGKACAFCHAMPPTSTNLNGAGKKFKANGNKL